MFYVTSDRRENCKGSVQWTVTDLTGRMFIEASVAVDIAAGKSDLVVSLNQREIVEKLGEKNLLVWLKLDVDGEAVSENLVTYVYPRELELLDPGSRPRLPRKGRASSP